ncbi:hypothetical protein VTP01DRAFT_10677 [Rhizomucor pusillus]|uniref:uncharacterized protein n=1 Tax=Rhizomucor pusillus TaxID=4840 RepID=UPI003744124D
MLRPVAARCMPGQQFVHRATTQATSLRSGSISLQDIEPKWQTLPQAERDAVYKHLDELQTQDWKTLLAEEKRAAYFVAFGPHGPRRPLTQPGHLWRVLAGVSGALAISSGIMYATRVGGAENPKTMSPEWREKTNEYLRSQNSNPITGISSKGYKGKGY